MVSGANAAPESIRSGEPGPNRSVRLSGETDCAIAPFTSAPASPTTGLSTSSRASSFSLSNRSFAIEESSKLQAPSGTVWTRQRLGGIPCKLRHDRVTHLASGHEAVLVAADVGGPQAVREHT